MLRRPSAGLEGLANTGRLPARDQADPLARTRQALVERSERAAELARRAGDDTRGKGRFR